MNPYFQEVYFQKHSVLKQANVKLKDVEKMTKSAYEEYIKDLIRSAKVLDHTADPCGDNFIPKNGVSSVNCALFIYSQNSLTQMPNKGITH